MFNAFMSLVSESVPAGELKANSLAPRLTVHHGVPAAASLLAYDPVRRILATGTTDGRLKVYGQNGIEVLFHVPTKAACKYLEFINYGDRLAVASTDNQLQIFDLELRTLSGSRPWVCEVTSIAVLQGTPFVLLGDDSGNLSAIQWQDPEVTPMAYTIPAHVTLDGIVRAGSFDCPSLLGILPHPMFPNTRVLLAYMNGIIIQWEFHDLKFSAVRGGSTKQLQKITEALKAKDKAGGAPPGMDSDADAAPVKEDKENELCVVCWACNYGSVVAAGYMDGRVRLWGLPPSTFLPAGQKLNFHAPAALTDVITGKPLSEVLLTGRSPRVPITVLKWSGSGSSGRGGGRLYVVGGEIMGFPEFVSVVALSSLENGEKSLGSIKLPWFGPVTDILMAPSHPHSKSSSSTPHATSDADEQRAPHFSSFKSVDAAIVLSAPGQVHVFEEKGIGKAVEASLNDSGASSTLPDPIPLEAPESAVALAKLCLVASDSPAASILMRLPRTVKERSPSKLSRVTDWPVSGGAFAPQSSEFIPEHGLCIYITGHVSGVVFVSDASTPLIHRLLQTPEKMFSTMDEVPHYEPVTALDFCHTTGMLLVGHVDGLVEVFELSGRDRKIHIHLMSMKGKQRKILLDVQPGFQCVAQFQISEDSIVAVSLATALGRLSFADKQGRVFVIDTSTYSILYQSEPIAEPIKSLHLTPLTIPAELGGSGAVEPYVVSLSKSGKLTLVHAINGKEFFTQDLAQMKDVVTTFFLEKSGWPIESLSLEASPEAPLSIASSPSPKQRGSLADSSSFGRKSAPNLMGSNSVKKDQVSILLSSKGGMSFSLRGAPSPTLPPPIDVSEKLKEMAVIGEEGGSVCEGKEAAHFLVVVKEDSAELYTVSNIVQMRADAPCIRSMRLFEEAPSARSVFSGVFGIRGSNYEDGIVFLSNKGNVEIRSLPDLAVIQKGSLNGYLGWDFESFSTLDKTAVAADGRICLLEGETEMSRLSLFQSENAINLPNSLPILCTDPVEDDSDSDQLSPSSKSSHSNFGSGVSLDSLTSPSASPHHDQLEEEKSKGSKTMKLKGMLGISKMQHGMDKMSKAVGIDKAMQGVHQINKAVGIDKAMHGVHQINKAVGIDKAIKTVGNVSSNVMKTTINTTTAVVNQSVHLSVGAVGAVGAMGAGAIGAVGAMGSSAVGMVGAMGSSTVGAMGALVMPSETPPAGSHSVQELVQLFQTNPFEVSVAEMKEEAFDQDLDFLLDDEETQQKKKKESVKKLEDDLKNNAFPEIVVGESLEPPSKEDKEAAAAASSGKKHHMFGFGKKKEATTSKPIADTKQKTGDAWSAAAEARQKLVERGEKLKQMRDNADELANEAADFSDLAAQIAKKQQKKWW